MKKALLLIAYCALLITHSFAAELQFRWETEVSEALPYNANAFQGETFTLEVGLRQYGQPLTGSATATFYYQTKEMAADQWYTAPAQWDTDAGRASVEFTPAMDNGATAYRFFFGIETSQGKNYRAYGTLRMKPSPGFNPAQLEAPNVYAEMINQTADKVIDITDAKYQPLGNYLTQELDPTIAAWAKAVTKPTYTYAEITGKPITFPPTAHTHTTDHVSGLAATVADRLYAFAIDHRDNAHSPVTANLNTQTRGGIYFCKNNANAPVQNKNALLLVANPEDAATPWVVQVYMALDSAGQSTDPAACALYTRRLSGATWSAWRPMGYHNVGAGLLWADGAVKAAIDTSMPASPQDVRMPSTKLLKAQLAQKANATHTHSQYLTADAETDPLWSAAEPEIEATLAALQEAIDTIDPVVSWDDVQQKPTAFTPAAHHHDSAYLKLSGGTLTGNLTLNGSDNFASHLTFGGTAQAAGLMTRGICGKESDNTRKAGLYLNYDGRDVPTSEYFGQSGEGRGVFVCGADAATKNAQVLRKMDGDTFYQPKGNYLTSFTETDPTIAAWAKAATKPTYAYSEITDAPTTWPWSSISGIPTAFTPAEHTHHTLTYTDGWGLRYAMNLTTMLPQITYTNGNAMGFFGSLTLPEGSGTAATQEWVNETLQSGFSASMETLQVAKDYNFGLAVNNASSLSEYPFFAGRFELSTGGLLQEKGLAIDAEGNVGQFDNSDISFKLFATLEDLAAKQDTLTAGSGITISGNTISALPQTPADSPSYDPAIDAESTNAVQNKAVAAALEALATPIALDGGGILAWPQTRAHVSLLTVTPDASDAISFSADNWPEGARLTCRLTLPDTFSGVPNGVHVLGYFDLEPASTYHLEAWAINGTLYLAPLYKE